MMPAKTIKNEQGFTLVELMISILICVILIGGLVGLTRVFQGMFAVSKDVSEAEQPLYFGMTMLTRELRQAESIIATATSSTQVTFITQPASVTMVYQISGTQLLRKKGAGDFIVVASNLNPASSSFSYIPASGTANEGVNIVLQGLYHNVETTIQNSVTLRN